MTGGTDFVIVGGGPAGLSAGITAARSGCSAVILEAGEVLGPRPRGEGVNHYRLFDELLGQGFLEEHALETTAGAVYHSPGASQQVLLPAKRPLYFFEWREFIDRLGEVAAEEGVEVRTGARVTGVLEEGGRCVGVRYVDAAGGDREVRGATVLGCDGHASVVGRHYGLPYDRMSCPMMKCRITEAGFDPDHTQALQFYLIGAGDLAHTPSFPPCVAYAFPLSGRQMEVGLMLRMSQAHGMAGVQMPDRQAFGSVWSHLKEEYPGFRDYFQGATIDIEEPTDLPNAHLVRDNVPAPGAVLVGDSVGFIDPFGSSGIYFSMQMAHQWVGMIAAALQAGNRTWTEADAARWRKEFRSSRASRHIRRSTLQVGLLEWYVFKHLRTSARMNKRWGVISALLKLG